ncbi:MAG: NAD(P)H-binding protein [Anaerolineae bacterium]
MTKACATRAGGAQCRDRAFHPGLVACRHPPRTPAEQLRARARLEAQGEDALRTSGLLYTIVRPGGLTDAPGGASALKVDQGDRISGMISRSDVAAVCVAALDEIATYHTTFEIVAEEGTPPEHLPNLFASLKTDRELNNPK